MSPKRLDQLPQLFRGPFLRKVACDSYYSELVERLDHAGILELLDCSLADIFTEIYALLMKSYRCEYVYKNSLALRWLTESSHFGQSFVTDEFRVGKNRVDLAIFADFTRAYEIKSEYDSTLRLPSQTTEYAKVFDRVYVVTSDRLKGKFTTDLPQNIGIITLNERGEFLKARESKSHAQQTNLSVAFDCLRRSEMVAIVESITKSLIDVPTSLIYAECKSKFRRLLPFDAQRLIAEQIRNRRYSTASEELLRVVPEALKHAALTIRASNSEMKRLQCALAEKPRPHQKPIPKDKAKPHYENILPLFQRQTKRVARVEVPC